METQVTNRWIAESIELLKWNPMACVDVRVLVPALEELQRRRRSEKLQGYTDHRVVDKNGSDGAQERENVVLPFPCTKGFEGWTVKQWLQKVNEELDEFKEMVFTEYGIDDSADGIEPHIKQIIGEEAADTITAITSMLEAMGINEQQRQEAQRRVNRRNRERGRL